MKYYNKKRWSGLSLRSLRRYPNNPSSLRLSFFVATDHIMTIIVASPTPTYRLPLITYLFHDRRWRRSSNHCLCGSCANFVDFDRPPNHCLKPTTTPDRCFSTLVFFVEFPTILDVLFYDNLETCFLSFHQLMF